MSVEIRVPVEDQWEELVLADARGFGFVPTEEEIARRRPIIDLERFRVAVDGGRIVGVAGSFALDVTVPGGASVPMSGVTWVSVSATHRRRGVLTRLLEACHADADERGEPVAMLFASEAGIYERFGYGMATHMREIVVDRRAAVFRPGLRPDPDAVRYVDHADALDHELKVFDRVRRMRAGEIGRADAFAAALHDGRGRPQGELSPAFHLHHRDGFAVYRIETHWGPIPAHRLDLVDLVAATPQAHLDLWNTVLGVDLVGRITARMMPIDEPLPYLLTNPRAVATTSLADGVWVNVRDVPISFAARIYGSADRLVVEADGTRWAIESAGPAATVADSAPASCRKVRTRPDLVTDHATLGALLMGGVAPTALAAGRRLEARSDEALRRADAFFVVQPAPHCSTMF